MQITPLSRRILTLQLSSGSAIRQTVRITMVGNHPRFFHLLRVQVYIYLSTCIRKPTYMSSLYSEDIIRLLIKYGYYYGFFIKFAIIKTS